MSELDSLLETYCKCTDCTCRQCRCGAAPEVKSMPTKNDLESMVWSRLQSINSFALPGFIPPRAFRPAAITAGLMLGVASIGLAQPGFSTPQNGLIAFSPNAPALPSTLLGGEH